MHSKRKKEIAGIPCQRALGSNPLRHYYENLMETPEAAGVDGCALREKVVFLSRA
jgi:hypothetical protein